MASVAMHFHGGGGVAPVAASSYLRLVSVNRRSACVAAAAAAAATQCGRLINSYNWTSLTHRRAVSLLRARPFIPPSGGDSEGASQISCRYLSCDI